MFDSLRVRLLAWYTAILAAVICIFGVSVCALAYRARLADVDAALRVRAEAMVQGLEPAADGHFDLTLPADPLPLDAIGAYYVVWSPDGSLIDRSDPDLDPATPVTVGARTRAGRREVTVPGPASSLVLVGQDLAAVRGEIFSLGGMLAGVGVAALGLSLAGGWLLVGRALAPINRISRTAERMTAGDFDARVPIDAIETELGQLGRSLNDAFDQLQMSLHRQRRFTADASHELRTPLATMITEIHWALNRDRTADDYQRSLETCRRAARRMESIVERLLELARAETGADRARREQVQLDDLVRQAVADIGPLASAEQVSLDLVSEPVTVVGDPDRLNDIAVNLLTNAIRYNVPGGRVQVTVRGGTRAASLIVEDTGMGIEPADLPRVFEPFFRADPARSRDRGGAGLGLAVSRALVEQHGGTINCASQPGVGTRVSVELPPASPIT